MKNTALITGASSGIGKELAIIHAKNKGDLILVARRTDKLEELKKELESQYGIQVVCISKDLSKPNSSKELYNQIKENNYDIDVLINNAGFGLRGEYYKLNWENQLQMMQLNMIALSELTHLILPEFVNKNKGRILNISSTASLMPGPLQAIYFATKAFVTSFSNALSEELCHTNITVTNLMPGATKTEFAQTAGLEKTNLFKKAFSAKKVATDAYKGMIKGKLNVISGISFAQKIMFSMLPFTPKKILLKQIKKMQEID